MHRYGLRDDEWDRIKDLLPGRKGHVGVTAKNNRLFVEAVLFRYRAAFLGETCLRGLGSGSRCTRATVGGRRAVFGREFSRLWRPMRTTNTP
jgi:transposase